MVYSPQDVYARHLVSGRGYPLWTPEPNMSLPDSYVRQGLKIGDVGVVVPEDGSFDVFFNVCLPPEHSLHRETGVPNNFTPILLTGRDITQFPEAEGAGRIISTSSVARMRDTDVPDEDPERRAQPGPLNYEFTLSSREGAVLILPEGAERYYLRNERLFLDQAIQHAVDWYTFAEQRLGRIISHDALYLITGFYKARSWSLAAYQQGAGAGESSAKFKAVQVGRGNIAASYTWETTHAMDWRVGPSDHYYHGIANQTVFIQGFKITVREGILGTKRVRVKADSPAVRPYRVEYSSGSWFSNPWGGGFGSSSGSTANAPKGTGTSFNVDSAESNLPVDDITIQRFPQVAKPFHPSDIINQHLLREFPSATVAVTHDSQWTTLLERGVLNHGELSQEDRLLAAVASNYSTVLAHESVVYLQSTAIENDDDDDEMATSTFSEEHSDLSSIPPETPTSQPSGSDLPATDDSFARPYVCAYGSALSTNPESSHAMYGTAHELQEHVTLAHPDIAGTHLPVFRCGLAGCGQSWKRIEELEYHILLSDAHSQNTTTVGPTGPFAEPSETRQVLPSIASARHADFGTSALYEPCATLPRDIYNFDNPASHPPPLSDPQDINHAFNYPGVGTDATHTTYTNVNSFLSSPFYYYPGRPVYGTDTRPTPLTPDSLSLDGANTARTNAYNPSPVATSPSSQASVPGSPERRRPRPLSAAVFPTARRARHVRWDTHSTLSDPLGPSCSNSDVYGRGLLIPQEQYTASNVLSLNAPDRGSITFNLETPDETGIPIIDLLNKTDGFARVRDGAQSFDMGKKFTVRVQWPGYGLWFKTISVMDWKKSRGSITRVELAEAVATAIGDMFKKYRDKQYDSDYAEWNVGPNGIQLGQICLVALHEVWRGSWQPQLCLLGARHTESQIDTGQSKPRMIPII